MLLVVLLPILVVPGEFGVEGAPGGVPGPDPGVVDLGDLLLGGADVDGHIAHRLGGQVGRLPGALGELHGGGDLAQVGLGGRRGPLALNRFEIALQVLVLVPEQGGGIGPSQCQFVHGVGVVVPDHVVELFDGVLVVLGHVRPPVHGDSRR